MSTDKHLAGLTPAELASLDDGSGDIYRAAGAERPGWVKLEDQALVFVVRGDGEPGLYLRPGVTNGHAILLFEMMIKRLSEDTPMVVIMPKLCRTIGRRKATTMP